VWGVHGAYTFYLLSKNDISQAYLVDDHFTKKVVNQSAKHPNLQLVPGDFRLKQTFDKFSFVDMIMLFDVLLH